VETAFVLCEVKQKQYLYWSLGLQEIEAPRCSRSGAFNLSDTAVHINNFSDARGPLIYIYCGI